MPEGGALDTLIKHTKSESGMSKGNTIATLKKNGLIEQKGDGLALTEKGRKAAKKARNNESRKRKGITTAYNG